MANRAGSTMVVVDVEPDPFERLLDEIERAAAARAAFVNGGHAVETNCKEALARTGRQSGGAERERQGDDGAGYELHKPSIRRVVHGGGLVYDTDSSFFPLEPTVNSSALDRPVDRGGKNPMNVVL